MTTGQRRRCAPIVRRRTALPRYLSGPGVPFPAAAAAPYRSTSLLDPRQGRLGQDATPREFWEPAGNTRRAATHAERGGEAGGAKSASTLLSGHTELGTHTHAHAHSVNLIRTCPSAGCRTRDAAVLRNHARIKHILKRRRRRRLSRLTEADVAVRLKRAQHNVQEPQEQEEGRRRLLAK